MDEWCCTPQVKIFSHASDVLKCTMRFAVYLPPQAEDGDVPVVYWLSGGPGTHENFITKGDIGGMKEGRGGG